MRAPVLVLLGLSACAHRATPAPPALESPERLPPIAVALPPIPAAELGAEGVASEWIELEMPADAKVLGYERGGETVRETWTLAEAGPKRVLRVRFVDGKSLGQAAWVGTSTKDGMALRLVEVRGHVRFASETLVAECMRDRVCEAGKPIHEMNALFCAFSGEGIAYQETAWFAQGKGVDFATGPCRIENTTRERLLKRPRGYMQRDF